MPTIPQLPAATQVDPADEVPLSQAGVTRAATVGELLAGVQPAISTSQGTLLGRLSVGAGGPEAVVVGAGLAVTDGALIATGGDHAGFSVQTTFVPSDEVVVSSAGSPRLMPVSALRQLFSAGSNVTIDSTGTISLGSVGSGSGIGPAGPQGATGPAGPQGPQGPAGATGSAGPTGPAGPQGQTGATGPAASAGSGTSISAAPIASTIAAGDLVGISQGGSDKALPYSTLLNGRLITDAGNATSGAMGDTDAFWIGQGGASSLTVGTLAQLFTFMQGKRRRRVDETASTNLTFARHHRALVGFPNGGTVSVLAVTDCGDGFECEIINTSSVPVVLGQNVVCSGSTTLQPNQSAAIRCVNSAVYAQTSASSSVGQSISIGTLGNQLANTTFSVAGTLAGYGTAPSLQFSDDGATWIGLPASSTMTTASFSFLHPALSAKSAVTVWVRDGNGVSRQSNGFNVESANLGTLPTFVAGQPSSVAFSLAGLTSAWLVWWNTVAAAEVGSRVAISSSPAAVTAPVAGSGYTLRIVDANSGGLQLVECPPFTVVPAPTEVLTLATPATSTVTRSIPVAGTFAGGSPVAFDWSVDALTWIAATGVAIGTNTFSFTIPSGAVAAGGPYTLRVRDRDVPAAIGTASGTFNIEGATLSGVPSVATNGVAITGSSAALAGLVTAYATLSASGFGSLDVGSRVAFTTGALPALTPTSAGTTSLRIYDSATAGSLLAESANISVNAANGLPGISAPVLQIDSSASNVLFADAARSTPQTTSGGAILGIADLSGNNNHLAQSTQSFAPTLAVNSQSGKAGLRFTGSSTQLLKQLPGANWMSSLQTTSSTYLLVFKPATIDTNTHAAFGIGASGATDGHNSMSFAIGGTAYVAAARNTVGAFNSNHATGFNTAGSLIKVICRTDASGLTVRALINTASETTTPISGALTGPAWDTFELGSSLPTFFLDGWIYEFDLWSSLASDAQRDALMTYATTKWGS